MPKKPPATPTTTINENANHHHMFDGCSVTVTPAVVNAHTQAAVEALAKACQANAEAIASCARALAGGNIHLDAGFKIG